MDMGDHSKCHRQVPRRPSTARNCPALWKLAIDGRNFYNTCEEGKWTWFEFPAVKDPAISRFTNPFLLQNLLSALSVMPNLAHLRLNDLALDPLDNAHDLDFISPSLLYSLVCEDIGVGALEYLIEYFDEVPNLKLTHCAIEYAHFAAETLTQKEIDDGHNHLGNMHCLWSGKNLYLHSCPGFDDTFLVNMCIHVPANGTNALSMKYLDISNCPNFSVPALKRFVESRERADYECAALEGMRILGDSPMLLT
jgi:hypothetical protein